MFNGHPFHFTGLDDLDDDGVPSCIRTLQGVTVIYGVYPMQLECDSNTTQLKVTPCENGSKVLIFPDNVFARGSIVIKDMKHYHVPVFHNISEQFVLKLDVLEPQSGVSAINLLITGDTMPCDLHVHKRVEFLKVTHRIRFDPSQYTETLRALEAKWSVVANFEDTHVKAFRLCDKSDQYNQLMTASVRINVWSDDQCDVVVVCVN